MFQRYLLPFFALAGAFLGLVMVGITQADLPAPTIAFPPLTSPFLHSIAGAGLIEPCSKNIAIGSPFNEIVARIYVIEGMSVKEGDPLLQLDVRNFEAALEVATASLKSSLETLEDKKTQFSFYERLQDATAVSEQEYQAARYAYLTAIENVRVAKAQVGEAKTNIERSLIRAPITGQILQVNVQKGEMAPIIPVVSPQTPTLLASNGSLILMGDVSTLQMRVDIDEEDAWRFRAGAKAVAFIRGNSRIQIPMDYVRIEPYIIPKRSFTGDTVERVDTRVLQVLYQFDKGDFPVYPGQILDVFIEAASEA